MSKHKPHRPLYEVLTAGENCWTTEHNGVTKQIVYATKTAARIALKEHIAGIRQAIKDGDMIPESYNPDEMSIGETRYVICDH